MKVLSQDYGLLAVSKCLFLTHLCVCGEVEEHFLELAH